MQGRYVYKSGFTNGRNAKGAVMMPSGACVLQHDDQLEGGGIIML